MAAGGPNADEVTEVVISAETMRAWVAEELAAPWRGIDVRRRLSLARHGSPAS